jgi:hypothetical protein
MKNKNFRFRISALVYTFYLKKNKKYNINYIITLCNILTEFIKKN